MSKTYPRAEPQHKPLWVKKPTPGLVCCVCQAPATHQVWVEVDWFRGNDEGPFKSCKQHKDDPKALLIAAHQPTKEQT